MTTPMPAKPVMTSPTNQKFQRRFDELAELAAANDWEGVAAYQEQGTHTYAKRIRRFRDDLLAAARGDGAAMWQDGRRRTHDDAGPLRLRLDREAAEGGANLDDLTVMTKRTDPYRLDTVANHRIAAWFKEHLETARVAGPIHIRGLHYRLVARGDVRLPGGKPYVNDDDCYVALNEAAKLARWLGYVGFDRIVDNRNEPPLILVPEDLEPRDGQPQTVADTVPYIPAASSMLPRIGLVDSNLVQPYRIILIGEKSSLREELEPVATEIGAELILPSGELSDTLIYDFVRRAARDGRPAVVIHFSDFDPAGNQMPVSDARKIQALRDFKFPDLQIELHHAALTIEQVRRLDLPSTPLKDGEKRGDRWREFTGQEQTEIDALMALHPGELGRIAREAVAPFYDFDAADRYDEAIREWEEDVNAALKTDPAYAAIEARIEAAAAAVQAGLGEIRSAQRTVSEIDVSMWQFEMPGCEPEGEPPEPLFDSRQPWREQTRRMKEKRNLGGGEDGGEGQ